MKLMNKLFSNCLKNKKIVVFNDAPKLIKKELKAAENDLERARETFKNAKDFKCATIQSYYSMFHTARCLLYKNGYREKSHICLIASMYSFYVNQKEIPKFIIDNLLLAKELRENADYENDFSKESAEELIKSADEFIKIAKTLLKN